MLAGSFSFTLYNFVLLFIGEKKLQSQARIQAMMKVYRSNNLNEETLVHSTELLPGDIIELANF